MQAPGFDDDLSLAAGVEIRLATSQAPVLRPIDRAATWMAATPYGGGHACAISAASKGMRKIVR